LKMLRSSLPSTIEIKQNVASKAAVLADPTQIHQVLMNLCTNAAHAMQGDSGMLQVTLADVCLGPESLPSHLELQQGPHVKLTVMDSGQGIDPSILDRIFDPFFTTKEQGVGTGLGLSVVHGIVKSHGGAIAVESLPGAGTSFHVFFPAIEAAAELPAAAAVTLPRGRERILVVDDEPALAKAATKMLERLGYRVEFRTNSVDALEAIHHQSKEEQFDLVITDMTMPHLTGADLAKELLKYHPRLAVLLCTGFSEKIDAEQAASLGIQGFLMKPVVLKELAAMVRKVLDERRD
jgi:two-component system, cell cycle sensor histidine kinase and response regulator CckA